MEADHRLAEEGRILRVVAQVVEDRLAQRLLESALARLQRVLSHIIHDWREDLCLTILGHCRRAMNPGGRVLITEMVLPPADTPHPGKMLDVMMLVGPGGQERTAQEYDALLGKAGFRLNRIVPTASAVSVVEAFVA